MLFKKIVVCGVVASLALLTAACSDSYEDVCEHINELNCSQGVKLDCKAFAEEAEKAEDKATDAEKEKADKAKECIMDAESCDALAKCNAD